MSAPSSVPVAPHPSRRVIVGVTAALALVFAAITATDYQFGSDSARYVGLAKSLAQGEGYVQFGQPERSFPPGFPLVLAPATLLAGDSFATIARWAAILGALVFPAVFAFARTRTAALPIALLTIFSAGFLDIIIGNPRSEPIYMVCSLGLIAWAHHRTSRPEHTGRWASAVAAGTAWLLMSVATRSIGIAAVGAVGMLVLERVARADTRRSRHTSELLIPLVAGVAFLVLWFAWTRLAPNPDGGPVSGGYVRALFLMDPHRPDLGGVSPIPFLARIARNLVIQVNHAAELLTQLPWLKPRWFSPFAAGVVALTVFGLWSEMRSPSRLGAWYFLAYGAILLFWPYDEGTRFLVPILPFLWLFAILGARGAMTALSAGNPQFRRGVIAVGVVCLLGAAASFLSQRADFSRQDQAFVLVWLLILGIAVFGWARAGRLIGASAKRFGRPLVIGALALYAAAGVARTAPAVLAQRRGSSFTDPVTEALREASRWIGTNTAPDASIQATYRVPIQFATGRKTVAFPNTGSPALLRRSVEASPPDFLIVLHDTEHPYYQPVDSEKFSIMLELFPGAWREVVRLRGSTVYAFR